MSFNMNLYSEILAEFDKAETRKDKIMVLRKYDDGRLREFFYCAFSPNIEFDVTVPEYKPSIVPAGLNDCYLHQEMTKMFRFIRNHPKRTPGLYGTKQQNILINILEGLHKDEAELLVKLIQKKLDVKFLTAAIVKEAYPGIDL